MTNLAVDANALQEARRCNVKYDCLQHRAALCEVVLLLGGHASW